jgi:hypothetical protein
MKQVFLIDVHSFSDVITNSSTDVFAFKSKKSVEAIEKLLRNLLKAGAEKDISVVCTVGETTILNFYNQYNDWLHYDKLSLDEFLKGFINWDDKSKAAKEDKIIVVKGTEDNSVPYWLSEYMVSELGAYRIHLG